MKASTMPLREVPVDHHLARRGQAHVGPPRLARGRHGGTQMILDTNGALKEAISLYGRAGYQRIQRYNDNSDAELFFAKDLS